MEWHRIVIGRRVRVRLPGPSAEAVEAVEVVGQLLGRDTSKFLDFGGIRAAPTEGDFRAAIRLDDGSILLAELDSIVGQEDG